MKKFVCVAIVGLLLAGCFDKPLTPEEQALVSELQSQLDQTKQMIADAQAQDAKYSGGAIKSLIAMRLEILKTNQSLIEQRVHSVESGAPVTIQTTILAADPKLAEEIAAQIAATEADLVNERLEAAQYGGLVGALKASAVATSENTLAMLEQRYLSAKFGLTPLIPATKNTSRTTADETGTEQDSLPKSAKVNAKPPAAEGPFGFAKGLTLEQIEAMTGTSLTIIDEAEHLYLSSSAPSANSAFEQYGLVISPVVGLCQIRAVGIDVESNSFGMQLRTEFDGLKESLTGLYGAPETLDALLPGSIWKDADDWMMSLYQKERYLSAQWALGEMNAKKNNIVNIALQARAQNRSKGYVALQYDFDNVNACEEEQENAKRSSL